MRKRGDLTVLVCGGRNYQDRRQVFATLDRVHRERTIGLVVHGAAPGADSLAEKWAKRQEVMYLGVPAPWGRLKRAAGPKRNTYMLDNAKPDLVVGFPGSAGTADMLRKARQVGVDVMAIEAVAGDRGSCGIE